MSIDLDAIQARADAAHVGPWETRTGAHASVTSASIHSGPRSIMVERDGYHFGYADLADAEFIAHARSDVPALVAEVRTLAADLLTAESHSFHHVLDGDPADVAAALDALPDRAVLTSESLTSFDMFLKEPLATMPRSAWFRAGFAAPIDSDFLARNYSPLVVIR